MKFSEMKFSLDNAEKGIATRLKQQVLHQPDLLESLVQLAVSDEKPASWRAAWVMNHIAKENKELIKPFIKDILSGFSRVTHENQKASLIRILSYYEPELEGYGDIVDECFQILSKPTDRPFVKSYSLDFLRKICDAEPELKREIALAIEEYSPSFETDYLSRKANKILKELRKGMVDIDY